MATSINQSRAMPQTELSNSPPILGSITKNKHEDLAIKTVNRIVKILVYLDSPWIAEAALPYIEDYISVLAPEVEVEIYLLHVITHTTNYRLGDGVVIADPYTEEEIKQTTNKTKDYLNQTGELLRRKGATVSAKVGINTDSSKEIEKTAEEISANLIVLFTHRRSWLSRLAFSGVADKVLQRKDDVPIMVVRVDDYS
ncbi:universal stress protein [Chloroflexota bacterium]